MPDHENLRFVAQPLKSAGMAIPETAPGDPTGSPGWGEPAQDEAVRAEALEILRDVLEWKLPPARWAGVAQIVRSMAVAVDAGDSDALREATAELELESPPRVTRVGAVPVPQPKQDREETIRLTDSLEPGKPPGGATRDGGSGHDDGRSRP